MYQYSEEDRELIAAARERKMSERKNDCTRWNCEQRERARRKCQQRRGSIGPI